MHFKFDFFSTLLILNLELSIGNALGHVLALALGHALALALVQGPGSPAGLATSPGIAWAALVSNPFFRTVAPALWRSRALPPTDSHDDS